jgi:hypothetical protein
MINIESLTLKELDELSKAIHVEKSNKLDAIDKKIEEFGKEWVKKNTPDPYSFTVSVRHSFYVEFGSVYIHSKVLSTTFYNKKKISRFVNDFSYEYSSLERVGLIDYSGSIDAYIKEIRKYADKIEKQYKTVDVNYDITMSLLYNRTIPYVKIDKLKTSSENVNGNTLYSPMIFHHFARDMVSEVCDPVKEFFPKHKASMYKDIELELDMPNGYINENW